MARVTSIVKCLHSALLRACLADRRPGKPGRYAGLGRNIGARVC